MTKRTLLVTGAAGGMGRAITRLLGPNHELVLTDVSATALDGFAKELDGEGYSIRATHAGDLGDVALLSALAGAVAGDMPLTLVHTAGLSPSQADWKRIMDVNLVTSVKLLDAVEPGLAAGSVAILIASSAGYAMPVIPQFQAILDEPLAPDLIDKLTPAIEHMSAGGPPAGAAGISYSLSKQAVLRLVEQRAIAWGKKGARITSISPGLILTPMGRSELTNTPGAAETRDAAPVGRAGTAMDIALAARFLASDDASFITGIDLRVDGGSTAAIRSDAAAGQG